MRGSRPSPSAKFVRSVCSSACGGSLVDLLGLADEPLELGLHDVDVDRDAGVLEREQADPQRPLDEGRAVVAGTLGQERGEPRVEDARRSMTMRSPSTRTRVGSGVGSARWRLGRQRADDGGVHDPNDGRARDI